MLERTRTCVFADPLITDDVRRVVATRPSLFDVLDGKRVLLTGGTGFVGRWMLRVVLGAAEILGIDVSVVVLTRRPTAFCTQDSELALHPAVELVTGDICEPTTITGAFDLVIHAAAQTNADRSDPLPLEYVTTGLEGTARIADVARQSGARRILFTSSAAAYGSAAFEQGHAHEASDSAPLTTDPHAAYGNAKRAAEAYLCALSASGGPAAIIARLFAFVGPGLPLRSGYAVGNFMADALAGGPIRILGDGRARRSYLYAAEMALWLWTIALEGQDMMVYNVGSQHSISILELAIRIRDLCGGHAEVSIANTLSEIRALSYVPSTDLARSRLGLDDGLDLDAALARTLGWHRIQAHIALGAAP